MKKTKILLSILSVIALIGALALVSKNQEMRKGASFANTTLSLLPSSKIIKNVDDEVLVKVYYQTESGAKVDGVQAVVCYGNELSLDKNTGVVANQSNGFESDPIVVVKDVGNGKCVTMVATSKKSAEQLKTTGEVFALKFKAMSPGEGELIIDKPKSMVTGDNSGSATDKEIAVTSVQNTSYKINFGTGEVTVVPTLPLRGDEPILNYKISFAYVKAGDANCGVDWPLQIIVLGGGETKVYSNVKPTLVTSTGTLNTYQGSLALTGFDTLSNVAVFIKGPKHLQMKYGIQNQSKSYDKAGGELTLTRSADTSPLYDFTAYPMLAGDVVGANSTSQDGWISGVDYSYTKTKADLHETISQGYLKGDLDGNCQVNSNDVNELKISLEAKQEELY